MVEGDGCHRVAAEHRRKLVGRTFTARSPNGRFKAGAVAIMKAGGVLLKIEIHGKNMFYFFGRKGSTPTLVVHIHFGMAGAFAVYAGEEPETTANTRLRLETKDSPRLAAHLSAMTVVHGTPEGLYRPLVQKLGQDPLREDADPKQVVSYCSNAKKPIGAILMDQSVFCGVGNIYRTEVLYEAGIHPNQPANTLSEKQVLHIWAIVVKQMQAGYKTGSIWGTKDTGFCYGRETSACGGKVSSWDMSGRTVYACSKKQRLESALVAVKQTTVQPGTAHIGKIVSAVKAETKKRKTGEGLAVQHVALKDDATLAAARAAARTKRAPLKRPTVAQSAMVSRKRPSAAITSEAKKRRR